MSPNGGSERPITAPPRPLNILHVMRAPVGGLFRHVADLARGQAARGHNVGIVADSTTGAKYAEAVLAELAPQLRLGLLRLPMSRHLGLRDIATARAVAGLVQQHAADVVHGHGAKGGAYARLTNGKRAIRVYTPHGGSLHYRRTSPVGLVYLSLEQLLLGRTELFLFESAYGQSAYRAHVGEPHSLTRVVHNGVTQAEFVSIAATADASDLVFIGELRRLKGVDVLIEALGLLARDGLHLSATMVGGGPDAEALRLQARALGLAGSIRFTGPLPARSGFGLGRLLVVPSRAESLPYIVIEAAAARMPIIATAVGGIPEIFGPQASELIAADSPAALAQAIRIALTNPAAARAAAEMLQARVAANFSVESMVDRILAGYSQALAGEAR
jgi:glycosyltransferase involved in cell wall biosynthesis